MHKILEYLTGYPFLIESITVTVLFWITWYYSLRGEFLIDDIEGINAYSEKWVQEKEKNGKILKEYKVDSYEVEIKGKKVRYKFLQFNPHLGIPGSLVRFIRLNLGKKFTVIGKTEKGHEVFGYIQSPFRHHLISLTLQNVNMLLLLPFISHIFGRDIAFLATLLACVHPIATQAVAWVSGIGYIQCLFGALMSFNIDFYVDNPFVKYPLIVFFSMVSSWGLFSGSFNWVIFLMLGSWWSALASSLVFIHSFFSFGKKFVTHRVGEFKKQNMGRSTFFTWRKLIVMVKTFQYYVHLMVFPQKLGLFHEWGYHYDEKIEVADRRFWLGTVYLIGSIFVLLYAPYPYKFAVVWFICYLMVFSNFITAMQFVVDRYAFCSIIGFSIAVSALTVNTVWIFTFILGMYMMRTLLHLPTYLDLRNFYLSNYLNFRKSEVALGNLGVTEMGVGRVGSAVDTWLEAIKINKHYDVPNYNMYSVMKQSGQYKQALDYLDCCLNAKTVHFPDQWKKEYDNLKKLVEQKSIHDLTKEMNQKIVSIQRSS